jgi:hypothetical protein
LTRRPTVLVRDLERAPDHAVMRGVVEADDADGPATVAPTIAPVTAEPEARAAAVAFVNRFADMAILVATP